MLTRLTNWISSFFQSSSRQLALEEAREAQDCAVECIGEEEEGGTTSEEEDTEREEEEREGEENMPIVHKEAQENSLVAGEVGVGRVGLGSGRQESVTRGQERGRRVSRGQEIECLECVALIWSMRASSYPRALGPSGSYPRAPQDNIVVWLLQRICG